MLSGFYDKYPDETYLTEEDKALLMKSPFFFYPDGRPVAEPLKELQRYAYDGGHFTKYSHGDESYWLEIRAEGSALYKFREKQRDETWILLHDRSRRMTVRLPISGGVSAWSTNNGGTWRPGNHVSRSDMP